MGLNDVAKLIDGYYCIKVVAKREDAGSVIQARMAICSVYSLICSRVTHVNMFSIVLSTIFRYTFSRIMYRI